MTVATVRTEGLEFRLDTHDLEKAFDRAPVMSYFWLRDFFFRLTVGHRIAWLRGKGTAFGRRGDDPSSRAIKVWKVNEGPDSPESQDVTFEVRPKLRKMTDVAAAVAGLNQLSAVHATGSSVLRVHETGEDIRSPEWMAIPIKTRPGSPEKWRAKNPGKTLVARPSRRTPGKILLYERIRTQRRGRPSKNKAKVAGRRRRGGRATRDQLRLRFILTKFIEMDPTLHFYDSWDQQVADRDRLFSEAADKIVRDLARGRVT